MATEQIMATWEKDANERVAVALATLTDRFGITLPEYPFERLDARMQQIRLIERHADVLDAIVAATEPKQAAKAPTKEAPNERSQTAKTER